MNRPSAPHADLVAPARPAPWRHIPALDGVRGLAALMVVVFHFYGLLPRPQQPLARVLTQFTALGQGGVDLFFVLSGFLITGILLRARGTPHAWRNFYGRRSLRIFPLYYLVIAGLAVATLALGYGWAAVRHAWWYWAYCQNIAETFFPGSHWEFPVANPQHFWSLAVEEHFYLIWPAVVLTIRSRRTLIATLLSFIAFSTLFRFALAACGYSPYLFTAARLDGLSLGALVAVLWDDDGAVRRLRHWAVWVLPACAAAVIVLYALSIGRRPAISDCLRSSLQAAGYAALLVLVRSARPGAVLHAAFANRPMRETGKYSYGMYVYHPFLILAHRALLARHPDWGRPGALLIGLLVVVTLTYAAAFLSWHLYESHFLKLKKYFEYSDPPTAAAAPARAPEDAAVAVAAP